MAAMLICFVIGLPWLGATIVLLIGDKKPRHQAALAIAFSLAAGVAALCLLPQASSQPAIAIHIGSAFGIFSFIADGMGILLALIATLIGSLAVIFSVDYMHGEKSLGRYYSLVLFFIGAMAGLVLTNSLLLVFVFWEITALCSYALISFENDNPKAVAGGIKALIITQLGGIGLLAGALLIYSQLGTYEISQILANVGKIPGDILAVVAFGFLAAAAAKSAQFPFQSWLPDAMEAPTPISALIHAATMVNAGVYLMARFYPSFKNVPGWSTAVVVVGVITALMAAMMALVSNDLKRVLAYSTVSQLGYMFYAIGTGGVFASQYHLLSHAVFKALLFLSAGAIIHSAGTRDMREMGGLSKKIPFVRNVFIIGSLALAGLPFLNGFWSKELILESGIEHGPIWAYSLMLVGTGITALYTFRCVWLVFFGKPRSSLHIHDAQPAMKVALLPLAIGTLTTFLLAGPMTRFFEDSLPFHEINVVSTLELMIEVLAAPATWLAMFIIALGIAAWWQRTRLVKLSQSLSWLGKAAEKSFGFEAINLAVVRATQNTSEFLRNAQTGYLSWNIVGIIAGLAVVLVLLIWGA